MTRLDRVLNLLEQYDQLASSAVHNECEQIAAESWLDIIRRDKEKLTKELIEHGCRRKN